ncbi:MAG: Gfo/Idh/MocA family oxidoreductase [Spirochaetes bacterium]|nr:Gfo/Idh/MocA family oxidoreductase [Spirochaetota bacterium]
MNLNRQKRYALVGVGSRSRIYWEALSQPEYQPHGILVALCDVNQTRMKYVNEIRKENYNLSPIPSYTEERFLDMIKNEKVDTVIVTSIDRTHHRYIISGMEAGCDVITEKPLTTTAERCEAILQTVVRTGKNLRVTFNYRYAPRNQRVKELLTQGVIGNILSVHFEWLLDTKHGADYFRRWHRDKRNSGGLMVHKATHHFDLVNWWLDTQPVSVYASGGLKFYGKENAELRGERYPYTRTTGIPDANRNPFALDLSQDLNLRRLYLEAETEDGYLRDQNVFGDGISIEDDIAVVVNYQSGATMSYHLTAYSPWEGFRIAFNGTKGRLEYEVVETSYVSGAEEDINRPDIRDAREIQIQEEAVITLRPHWGKPQRIPLSSGRAGGHGGADAILLRDLFIGDRQDPLGLRANHKAGAWSILTGIAANKSMEEKRLVYIKEIAPSALGVR